MQATLEDGVTRRDQDVRIKDSRGAGSISSISTSPIRNKHDVIVGGVETFQSLGVALHRREARFAARGRLRSSATAPPCSNSWLCCPMRRLRGDGGPGRGVGDRQGFVRPGHPPAESPGRGPSVAFSCSALVETLIESELFGHVKGAFTGAISHKVGRFEMAKGGTLFLDEIGELKLALQAKLLRVLESKVFERVGSSQPIPMEARIIAATSRNLVEEVRRGRFRMDLLYRLRTVPFSLPPLRERRRIFRCW